MKNDLHRFSLLLSDRIKHSFKRLRMVPSVSIDQYFHCTLTCFIICLRHFDAIRILCNNGFFEDAIAIKRSMFESTLFLRLFAKDDINAVKWILYSGFVKDCKRTYSIEYINSVFDKYSVDRKYINDLFSIRKEKKAILKPSWVQDKKQAAEDVGLEKEYLRSYMFSHSFIHPSGVYLNCYVQYDMPQQQLSVLLNPVPPNEQYVSLLLLDSSLLMVKAVESFNIKPKIYCTNRIARIKNALENRIDRFVALYGEDK